MPRKRKGEPLHVWRVRLHLALGPRGLTREKVDQVVLAKDDIEAREKVAAESNLEALATVFRGNALRSVVPTLRFIEIEHLAQVDIP